MINRRKLLVALGASAFAGPLASVAQRLPALRRIAYFTAGAVNANTQEIEAFVKGMHELGYVEGKNIKLELRGADGNPTRLPQIATELVRLPVEVIVTGGPQSTSAAKRADPKVAVVMTNDTDPVGSGVIASLSRPGGNVTGLTNISSEVSPKRLELLKETIPSLTRVAVFGNAAIPGNMQAMKSTEEAARKFGITLQYLEVKARNDIETAFRAAAKEHAQALVVLQNFVITNHSAHFREFVEKARLPTIVSNQRIVGAGGLMYYGPSVTAQYQRAAIFVDKILKGARPADLPVEQPTKFELVVNVKVAKALGIKLPSSILVRADRVIE